MLTSLALVCWPTWQPQVGSENPGNSGGVLKQEAYDGIAKWLDQETTARQDQMSSVDNTLKSITETLHKLETNGSDQKPGDETKSQQHHERCHRSGCGEISRVATASVAGTVLAALSAEEVRGNREDEGHA